MKKLWKKPRNYLKTESQAKLQLSAKKLNQHKAARLHLSSQRIPSRSQDLLLSSWLTKLLKRLYIARIAVTKSLRHSEAITYVIQARFKLSPENRVKAIWTCRSTLCTSVTSAQKSSTTSKSFPLISTSTNCKSKHTREVNTKTWTRMWLSEEWLW